MKRLTLGMVLLVAPLAAGQAPDAQPTLTYLHSLEVPGGGYRADAKAKAPSLRATLSAVRALQHFGGRPRHPEAAAQFVASCFDAAAGGFGDTPGARPAVG